MSTPFIIEQLIAKAEKSDEALIPLVEEFLNAATEQRVELFAYYKDIKEIAEQKKNSLTYAEGIILLLDGFNAFVKSEYNEGIKSSNEAAEALLEQGLTNIAGVTLMVSGMCSRSLGDMDNAVRSLTRGVNLISPNCSLAFYIGGIYYQLGEINLYIKDLDAALHYYNLSLERAEIDENPNRKFRSYSGLASLSMVRNELEKAEEYLSQAELLTSLGEIQASKLKCDQGILYIKQGKPDVAIEVLNDSYQIRTTYNQMDAASTCLIHLGEAYIELKDEKNAIDLLEEAIKITEDFRAEAKRALCYELLWKAYEQLGDWENASKAARTYNNIQTKINEEQIQNVYKLKNSKIEEQRILLEDKNNELIDSITYAKRIQEAILPPVHLIRESLSESFVLYKPKDIVAGDFYWFERSQDNIMIAACDCTGHGVPGAMVSVICNNGLNRSVREYGLSDPGQILDKTREIVITGFEKSKDEVKDGMDIALVSLGTSRTSATLLKYAGANNPLWIVRKGATEIEEVKANKQPIGKYSDNKPFTTHEVELKKGDAIYIFTDGFVDQFGGDKGKKFKAANFKNLILSVQNESMERQKEMIDAVFENWRGNLEQVDDVCVIGVRI